MIVGRVTNLQQANDGGRFNLDTKIELNEHATSRELEMSHQTTARLQFVMTGNEDLKQNQIKETC